MTGLDVTAEPIYFLNEQHITGDISFAIRQYLYMTRDIQFLNVSGEELVTDIAEFWASRVYFNASRNMYEIHSKCTFSTDEHARVLVVRKSTFSKDTMNSFANKEIL